MEERKLTLRIKAKAKDLGFDAVAVAPASALPEDHLQVWLERGYEGKMTYMVRNAEKRLDPSKVLPDVRSVISVALNYFHKSELPYDRPDRAVISRYATGDDYHDIVQNRLCLLLQFIQELAPSAHGKVYVDTGPVMDKHWAAESGIGWLGKHTNVLSRETGSWVFLGEILLSLELDYDGPGVDFCGSCTRCIDACPTQAIVEPYVLDSRRCISYLTIELRDEIPEQFREPMGNLVFGCDICQDVCPWNSGVSESRVEALRSRASNHRPRLRELARLSPEQFRRLYRRSPIKRTKWRGFMRNVAVAMGNARDPEMVPELIELLNSEDEMIGRHAAWALRRIGTCEALSALKVWEEKASSQGGGVRPAS